MGYTQSLSSLKPFGLLQLSGMDDPLSLPTEDFSIKNYCTSAVPVLILLDTKYCRGA